MTVLDVSELEKSFGGETAVDGLSLSVSRGTIYCLLGPNGAGKSTTVRLAMGLGRPDSGSVSLFGADPYREPAEARRSVGYLPDQFSPYENLSGREHLEYVRDVFDGTEDLDRALSLVGLEDAAEKRATEYSEGMKRRLGIAMTVVGEPDLLLLDEPFANLDPDGVDVARNIVEAEHRRGATVLITTHQIDVLDDLAEEIGFISNGSLVAEGTFPDLCRKSGLDTTVTVSGARPDRLREWADGAEAVRSSTVEGNAVRLSAASPAVEEALREHFPDADVLAREAPTVRDLYRAFVSENGGRER